MSSGPPKGERVRDTVARLSSAQKTSQGAPLYSRFVNRQAGRWLAALAYHAGLTPNQVTGISACFSALGIALIALWRPSVGLGLAIAALLALGYAFDSADGQLARLRGGGSPAGEWLDHVVDNAKLAALHLAVAIGWYRFGELPDNRLLLLPLAYEFVACVFFFTIILNEQLIRTHGLAAPRDAPAPVWRALLLSPSDYGLLLISFVSFGLPSVFRWWYALLLIGNAVLLGVGLIKWFRALSRLPSPAR